MKTNQLYYGDNLSILQNPEYFPNECVDLIYLDPPFNSKRPYNYILKDESGNTTDAQFQAFDDTWHWGPSAQKTFHDLVTDGPAQISITIDAIHRILGKNSLMAYLVMMTGRLVELHRVLKRTGSIYVHCDPTASHYLKIIMDAIFGAKHFRNEIIWQRTSSHNDAKKWARVHDVILYYTKSSRFTWIPVHTKHKSAYVKNFYRYEDERGVYRLDHIIRSKKMEKRPNLSYEFNGYTPEWGWRTEKKKLERLAAEDRLYWSKTGRPYLKRYLQDQKGTAIKDVITDINPLGGLSKENLGYQTQKPEALLERIILSSSNEGDVVLDPFCGCGTTIAAAANLKRRWIGVDINHISVTLQKARLADAHPDIKYEVIGEPQDVASARRLANDDEFQFEWWALSLVGAKPRQGEAGSRKGKKGADQGIDGIISFLANEKDNVGRTLVQVKSGKVGVKDIRDLVGAMDREKAAMGLFITLEPPTKDMLKEATAADFYTSDYWEQKYPRVQILTIEELFAGKVFQLPPRRRAFPAAPLAKPRGETRSFGGGFDGPVSISGAGSGQKMLL